jgi:hypothetical protein
MGITAGSRSLGQTGEGAGGGNVVTWQEVTVATSRPSISAEAVGGRFDKGGSFIFARLLYANPHDDAKAMMA